MGHLGGGVQETPTPLDYSSSPGVERDEQSGLEKERSESLTQVDTKGLGTDEMRFPWDRLQRARDTYV